MPKPPKPRPLRLKVVPPTRQERTQASDLAGLHPWQLTYGEFLRRAISEYGLALHGPADKPAQLLYLKRTDGRSAVLPPGLGEDEILDEFVTASLCRILGIPLEDFGLHSEEPDADGAE